MKNDEAYERAQRRVEAKIRFYIHLTVYVGVNILLIIINLASSRDISGSSGRSWDGALVSSSTLCLFSSSLAVDSKESKTG